MKIRRKRSKAAGVSLLLSTVYLFYAFSYFYQDILSSYASLVLGGHVARALVLPHLLASLSGVCLNYLGFSLNKQRFLLAAGLFYTAAAFSFPPLSRYLFISLLLTFLACLRMPEDMELAEKWN